MTGELLAAAALTLFSVNIMLTRMAASRVNIQTGFLVSVFVNVIFSFLLLMGRVLLYSEPLEWNTSGFFFFVFAGVFSTYLGRWLFYDSIVKLGPAKASAFQASNPLFTVIIAWLFLREGLSLPDVAAATLIILGLGMVSYVREVSRREHIILQGGGIWKRGGKIAPLVIHSLLGPGVLIGVFSAASYASGNVLRGAAIQNWNEPIAGAFIGATLGLTLHLLTGSKLSSTWRRLREANVYGLHLFAITGILTVSAQILVITSMIYIPVAIASLITMATPVLVMPMSYFLLKNQEGVSMRTVLGIALILAGICLILLR